MEFEEVREYQSGDEIRSIDWNVTARMQKPYVKQFREERELTVMLLVDISSSTRFGTGNELKSDLVTEIAGIFAFSAIKNHDKIGLILFSDKVDKYILPKKGSRHVLRIIRELIVTRSTSTKTDLANALRFFGRVQKQKAICFLISDFICNDFSKEIAPLGKKHDLIAIRIFDAKEIEFPKLSAVQFRDLETQQSSWVDTSSTESLKTLKETTLKRCTRYADVIKRCGGDWIDIETGISYIPTIRRYLKAKNERIRP